MLRISIKNNLTKAMGLFFICLIFILFTLSIEAVFPYFNPVPPNLLLRPVPTNTGYLNTSLIPINTTNYPLNTTNYPQGFSYKDYFAAYPYLQSQNSLNVSSTNGSVTNPVSNPTGYITNSNGYTTRYTPQIYNSGVFNPYIIYQPVNSYKPTNYSTLSSSIYQTVPIYTNNNNTNTQPQTPLPQTGTYGQPNISTGNYVPTGQNGYYAPAQPQNPPTYSPYPVPNFPQSSTYPQNQPNVYLPANPSTSNQAPVTGYYYPTSNYWPNTEISEPDPPAEINGGYRGEWVSNAVSAAGEICMAEIDQFDAQIDGEIKLKEFTIGTSGRTDITGTVNGNTVNLEIDLDGPVLIFEGTVQSNGSIVGSYTVEGSSGSILDEGTLTLSPR